MELTKGQQKGLEIACRRYREHKPYTVIAGYAGTGKSTLVRFIIEELDLFESDVVYAAYTGQAVRVLKQKGNDNAVTTHKLLYFSKQKPDGTFIHTPRTVLEYNYKLIVVDEASMVPSEMIDLLLSHKVHVIFLGDNEQLPPVEGSQDLLKSPHVFLDEIVRQALESPIIKMSMDVRNGTPFQYGGNKECRVISKEKISNNLLVGADVVIVGKNFTRHQMNDQIRQLKWGDKYVKDPIDGDKCICLKNHWDCIGSCGNPIINGLLVTIHNIKIVSKKPYGKVIYADLVSDDGDTFTNLMIDYNLLTTGEPTINADNWKQFYKKKKPFELSYGYAITCHKSQGAEYDRVLVYDEAFGDYEQRRRWRYTAVTRASKQLIVAI